MAKTMDHSAYPKRMRSKTDAELRYIIKDASEAQAANPQGENNGYYADEVCYAAQELRRRDGRLSCTMRR
jgi:hypothetical protein